MVKGMTVDNLSTSTTPEVEELKQSVERLQALIDKAPIGILNVDVKGKITYVNKRFEEVSGYSREEVVGKNGLKLGMLSNETVKLLGKRMKDRLMGKPPRLLEVQFKCKDGHWIWVAIEGKLMREKGIPLGFQLTARDITERKQAEEVLRKIEQEKLAILNSMLEHVVYQDTEHRILWTNKAAAESVDLPTEQLVGCYCYEIWPQRSEPCVGCPVAKARESGKPQEAEITTPDGRAWFIRGYPIRDTNDDLVGMVEVTLEITERKRAEEALKAEKNKLRSVIDALEDGLTIQDKDYNIIYQNELVRKIFGDHLGEKCYRVYEGREKMCNGCPVEKAFKDGKSHTSERKVVIPSGEVTFWENTANPIRDAEGKIVSCLEVAQNITERKQAEEALRQSQEALQKMFESVTDGISVIDLNGIITEVNQRTVEMHGFSSKDELVGKSAIELVAPHDHEKIATNMRQALKQGIIRSVEYTLLKADGSEFPGELSTSVLTDTAGKVIGHITIVRDITKRKQGEEALERTSKDLWLVNLINNAANQGYSLQRILQLVTHEAKKIFSGYEATFYHISEDKKYLIIQNLNLPQAVVSSIEKLIGMKIPPVRIRLQEGSLYLKALQADKPQIINDPEAIQRLMAECTENKLLKKLVPRIYKLLDLHSVIQVPLVSEGEVIGLLDISRKEPFTELELERFATIVQQLLIIIERKRADEELKLRAQILDGATDSIFLHDFDGNFVYVNEAACRTHGYSREEFMKMKLHQVIAPERVSRLDSDFQEMLEKGQVIFESAHLRKDGSIMPAEVHGRTLESGRKKLLLTVIRDTTERKRMEDALQTEKNKLQSIINAMEDGLTIQDKDYNIIYQNELVRKIFGDHLGEKCYRVYEGREKMCNGCPVEKAFKDGKSHTSERKVVIPSGEVTFWENTANPIRDAEGKIVSCLEINRNITEHKQAEEALRQSQEALQKMFESVTDGISVIDLNGIITEVNQRTAEMHGFSSKDELVGKSAIELVAPRDHKRIASNMRQALKEGSIRSVEYTLLKADGSEFPGELSTSALTDTAGKVIGSITIARDITERKQMEELFKMVTNSSPIGIHIIQDGKFQLVNPQFQKLTGYTEDELLGMDSLALVLADDKDMVREKAIKMLKGELSSPYQFRVVNKAEETRWVMETVTSIQYRGRRAILGNYMDITERKQAEEKVRSAAEEWRTTFDSITDLISIHDRANRIVRVNKAFADALKITPEKLTGKVCHQLMHGTKEPPANCPHRQTLKTRKPATIEVFDPKLGIYVQESTSPIFDEKGEVAGSVHITKNITERKRMEEQLMLTDRLASIGELASGIAHELNNPLTSVIGFSQLLMEENIPDNLKEDLGTIYSEAQRASTIVKNLLTFSRKHAPMRQLSQVNTIIEDVLRLRAYEHKVNNIEVDKKFATKLPEIMVDYFQMQQVFLNIIANAESAMLEANGRGKLVITTGKINNVIKVTIADDGPGIARENLRRVFDPFFTTKEVGRGTGLGLSICHGIVTGHGGRIYAESEINKGATFVVELPVEGRWGARRYRHDKG